MKQRYPETRNPKTLIAEMKIHNPTTNTSRKIEHVRKIGQVKVAVVLGGLFLEFRSTCEIVNHRRKPTWRDLKGYRQILPVDLVDVEVGKEYELVITTYAGLYRYRVGDILRVTGFHNSAPQFHFVRRKNVLLSIDADKTDEAELQNAIDNASRLLREFNTSVGEYTSYANTKTIPVGGSGSGSGSGAGDGSRRCLPSWMAAVNVNKSDGEGLDLNSNSNSKEPADILECFGLVKHV
ncbi:hypothetical protein KPL71_011600 [Citrus sinensis]|uniref:Uncharacterized protein n=1 Tax=Citrus sinensis TaxID=2711 RepID=A0ACB8L5E1_CITSI|nr:hypothetical protein KPL71_011600 [Citrus sinensis]